MAGARADRASAVRITVHAKPRAKASRIASATGLTASVLVAAPPVEGAANEELVSVLASALGVRKRDVRLVGGASSKNKVFEVTGVGEAEVVARLAAASAAAR
jgi:uncharacterized protein (TIGR00251 family)